MHFTVNLRIAERSAGTVFSTISCAIDPGFQALERGAVADDSLRHYATSGRGRDSACGRGDEGASSQCLASTVGDGLPADKADMSLCEGIERFRDDCCFTENDRFCWSVAADTKTCNEKYEKSLLSSFQSMTELRQRLNYLHLMNKAAESGDQQGYFYYLMKAEKAARDEGQNAESFGPVSSAADLNT